MASSIINICVAKELNKYLNRKEKDILIGSIAPDISKQIGMTKEKSHFLDNNDDIPNLEKFLKKYKKNLNDDFVMGYYIHLFTDYLWFKYFITNFIKESKVYKLNVETTNLNEQEKLKLIYNDYTILNRILLDEYELDLSMFYEEKPKFKNIIKEIPMDKIQTIIDKTGIIIKNATPTKSYIFDIEIINKFIDFSVSNILANIDNLKTNQ